MKRPNKTNVKGVSKYSREFGYKPASRVYECSFRDVYQACQKWLLANEPGAVAKHARHCTSSAK
jgi:hypothetical protein